MKYIILCILLVNIVFSSKLANQNHLTSGGLGNILKITSFGNGLISMVKLFSMSKDNQDAEYEDLFEALEYLKSTLRGKITKEDQDYTIETTEHNEFQSQAESQVQKLKGQVATQEDERDEFELSQQQYELVLRNLETQSESIQQEIEATNTSIVETNQKAKEVDDEYNEVAQVFLEILELLNESLVHAQNTVVEFIETNQLNFQSLSVLLQKHHRESKIMKSFYVQPMIDVLTELQSDQAQVSTERIEKVIEVIKQLELKMAQGQAQNEQQRAELVGQYETLVQTYQNELEPLQVQIPEVTADIEGLGQQIESKSLLIASLEVEIQGIQDDISEEQESFDKRTEMNEILIPKLNAQIEIVEAAHTLLVEARVRNGSEIQEQTQQESQESESQENQQEPESQENQVEPDGEVEPVETF